MIALIRLLVALASFVACAANASAPVTKYWLNSGGVTEAASATTKAEACTKGGVVYNANMKTGWTWGLSFSNMCTAYNAQGQGWFDVGFNSASLCDDNSKPDLTKPLDQQCGITCPASGTAGTVDWPGGYVGADGRVIGSLLPSPSSGQQVNVGGCAVKVTDFTGRCASDSSKPYPQLAMCTYNTTSTGAAAPSGTPGVPAAPAPPSTSPDATGKCPAGTVSGGLDSAGTPICIGSGSSSPSAGNTTTTTSPKVTNPDGSTSQTTTKTTTNSDGSKTTETSTTTTNPDGSTSTSGTVTTSSNGIGKPGVADKEDSNDLCAKHPELNVCKNSSVAGSCGNVTCTGDAIQCAIYRQQQKEYCENRTDDANSTFGKKLLSGADPMQSQISGALAGSTVDLGSTSLDQSGFVGGGSCFPNKSITVLGHSVSVSFTNVCSNITPIRYIVLSCSLLVAYLLVSKSVLQG